MLECEKLSERNVLRGNMNTAFPHSTVGEMLLCKQVGMEQPPQQDLELSPTCDRMIILSGTTDE